MWILLTIRSFLCLIMIVQEMLPLWSLIALSRDEHFLVNIMTEDDDVCWFKEEEENWKIINEKISHSTIPCLIAIYLNCWISFALHIVKNDFFNVECMLHLCRRWMCRCNKSWQLHPVVHILFIYFPHNTAKKSLQVRKNGRKMNEGNLHLQVAVDGWLVSLPACCIVIILARSLVVKNAPETHSMPIIIWK